MPTGLAFAPLLDRVVRDAAPGGAVTGQGGLEKRVHDLEDCPACFLAAFAFAIRDVDCFISPIVPANGE